MVRIITILSYLIIFSLCFTNCSKFVAKTENFNSNQQPLDNENSNNRSNLAVPTCKVIQISGQQTIVGAPLNYSIEFNGYFESFDISCDQGLSHTEILSSKSTSPITLSILNLTIGKHTCLLNGRSKRESIPCSNSLYVDVVENSPSSNPIVEPPSNPVTLPPAPTPELTQTQEDQFVDMVPLFKEQLNPDSSSQLIQTGENYYRFQIVDAGRNGLKLKFFAPPGTVQIASNLLVVSAAKAVWRFRIPPATLAQSLSGEKIFNYGQTLLSELETKNEIFFSTENPGMLPFDTGSGGVSKPLVGGGYVYIDLSYSSWPTFTTTLIVEKKCYDQWYKSVLTKWKEGRPDSTAAHTCK